MKVVWNGRLVDESEVVISAMSPTVMYGHGVFETMRTYNGKIFEMERHLKRLRKSLELVKLDIEMPDRDYFESCFEMLDFEERQEYRCKILVCKEGFLCMALGVDFDESLLVEGIKCGVMKIDRSIPGAKKISYVDSHVAALQARENKVGETLLVASDGIVTEGAYSNVFWVKGDKIFTTSVERVLPGITREIVMELVYVEEVEVGLEALKEADEVFLTKTTLGVVPVVEIDGLKFEIGNMTREIQEKFNEYVKCGMEN